MRRGSIYHIMRESCIEYAIESLRLDRITVFQSCYKIVSLDSFILALNILVFEKRGLLKGVGTRQSYTP